MDNPPGPKRTAAHKKNGRGVQNKAVRFPTEWRANQKTSLAHASRPNVRRANSTNRARAALLTMSAPRRKPITKPGVAIRNGVRFDRKARYHADQRSPPPCSETIN